MRSRLQEHIVDIVPMIPVLKVDKHTYSLMDTSPTGSIINLLVVFGAMSLEETVSLTSTLRSISIPDATPKIDPQGIVPGKENIVSVTVPCAHLGDALAFLSKLPQSIWIEQQDPFLPSNRWASGVCQSGDDSFTPLFEINISGHDQIIGISDSGIDMTHCHFYDPDVSTPYNTIDMKHRKVIYYNSYADKVDDTEGHGTHVSSSAAEKSMVTYGDFVKYDGNARDAKIAFFDVGELGKTSLTVPSDINNGLLVPLYNVGAKISTHSWGNPTSGNSNNNKYTANARAVDSFMVDHPDALVFFAAGNEGIEVGANSVGSPATNKNGVSVGASLNSHNSWRAMTAGKANKKQYSEIFMAGFSSEGPAEDGRLKPDLAAPGWTINAAAADSSAGNGHCSIKSNQGTSMASPTAAGNAVLVLQYFTEGWYPSGSKRESDAFSPSGWSSHQGHADDIRRSHGFYHFK